MHLSRKCILLLLDGMLYEYQLSLFGLISHLRCVLPLLIFCLDDLSAGVNEVLKFPTTPVVLSMSPFMAVKVQV